MELQILAILDKAKPDKENIRDLNLAAVKYTTVQVSRRRCSLDSCQLGVTEALCILHKRMPCIVLRVINIKQNTVYKLTVD